MEVKRIHPFDLYDKLLPLSNEQLMAVVSSHNSIDLDGIRYVEDRTLPYDREAAKRNELLSQNP